ncbi:MAG: AsmA-like C-terminal domain-containing protein, partial [Alphaproteobacteria bacterium]
LRDLVTGALVPRRLELVRPDVRITRAADGTFSFGLGEELAAGDGDSDAVATLLAGLKASPDAPDTPMAALTQLRVSGGRITVDDRLMRLSWVAPRADLDLVRDDRAIRGTIKLDVELDRRVAALEAELTYSLVSEDTVVDLTIANFVPAGLANSDPILAPLSVVATPVSGMITLTLGPRFVPTSGIFALQGGAGLIWARELYPEPLPVAGLALSGAVDLQSDILTIDLFAVDFGGPKVRGRATVVDTDGALQVEATADVENMPTDLLATYWPPDVSTGARDWVTTNLSLGVVRRATANLFATIPIADPAQAGLISLAGDLEFDGVTVRYLEGMPPVTGVDGTATFDQDGFQLSLGSGRLLDLSVVDSNIAITGFANPVETIDIDLAVTGPMNAALEVLDSPRLGYISDWGIDHGDVTGSMSGRLRFSFPLIGELTLDQLGVAAAANLRGVNLTHPLTGPLTDIDGALDLDGRGMILEGHARLRGIPIDFTWSEKFSDSQGYLTRLSVAGRLDRSTMDALAINPYDGWSGPVGVSAVYTDLDRTQATLATELELSDATLRIDELAWEKPAGEPANLTVELRLENGVVSGISAATFQSPGLMARGSAEFIPGTFDIQQAILSEFVHGPTRMAGEVTRLRSGGYAIGAHGPTLDARPIVDLAFEATAADAEPEPPTAVDTPSVPLQVTLAFDRVISSDRGALNNVNGVLARDRSGWDEFLLTALTDTGGAFQMRYEPIGEGDHQLTLTAEDAGAALQALGLTANVRDGRLSVTGVQEGDNDGPLRGSIRLSEYRLIDAPGLARLLAALSLGGLRDLLNTEGLNFRQLTAEYTLADDLLSVRDTRTSGGALGLTMNGEFDLAADRMNIEGTIVPIYGVNQIIGAIPILGTILTGGSGQGVFAFTYAAEGPLREPTVTVNPLAVLAPGFLRTLFFLDGELGSAAEPSATDIEPAPGREP